MRELVEDLMWIADTAEGGLGIVEEDLTPTDYQTAYTVADVERFIAEFEDVDTLACDVETTSLFAETGEAIVAIGFSKGQGYGRSIPLLAPGLMTTHWWSDEDYQKVLALVKTVLIKKTLYGHNFIQFDQKWIEFTFGIICNIDFDTQCTHYLLDEMPGHGLKQLAVQLCGMANWKSEFTVKDTVQCCTYLAKDVDATWRLRQILEPEIKKYPKLYWILNNQLIPLSHELRRMEQNGVVIDQTALDKLDKYLYSRLNETDGRLKDMACVQAYQLESNTTFNPDAPHQVAYVMEKVLKLPKLDRIGETGSGGYSTGIKVLEVYKKELFVSSIIEYRQLKKLHGCYCKGIKERIRPNGKIHTSFVPHFTVTGRLSSRDPNLQNIPRDDTAGKVLEDAAMIKNLFISSGENRVLIQGDLSQIELRVLAVVSGDPVLIKAYQDGKDLHQETAAVIYGVPYEKVSKGQRSNSKITNFGIVYGMSFQTLLEKFLAAGNTEQEAINFYQNHQRTFSRVWNWIAEQTSIVSRQGWQENFLGRRRRYEKVDNEAKRQASNFPIQGGAAEVTADWIIRSSKLIREYEFDAFPVLTVHDSETFDSAESCMWEVAELIQRVAETPRYSILKSIPVKADIEIGKSWGAMKKVDVANRCFVKEK